MLKMNARQARAAAGVLVHAREQLVERRVDLTYDADFHRWRRDHGRKEWVQSQIESLDRLCEALEGLAVLFGDVPDDAEPRTGTRGAAALPLAPQAALGASPAWWD